MVPSHCLDYIWSQRNKPGNEHLAPTVRATIAHVQSLTDSGITTCFGDPSMGARYRARVVEYWVQVAQVFWGRSRGVPLWILGNGLFPFSVLWFEAFHRL